jgi:hypothetical protein
VEPSDDRYRRAEPLEPDPADDTVTSPFVKLLTAVCAAVLFTGLYFVFTATTAGETTLGWSLVWGATVGLFLLAYLGGFLPWRPRLRRESDGERLSEFE